MHYPFVWLPGYLLIVVMVNLFTTYYTDEARQGELDEVLLLNIRNNCIDRMYLLDESGKLNNENPKVSVQEQVGRPTFADLITWVNAVTEPGDVNIIANSDIYFDPAAIEMMKLMLGDDECWALTRWDTAECGSVVSRAVFMNRRDSHDSFCFRGLIKPIVADFQMGLGGCDNRFCYEIQQSGYKISNPSWTVKTYHLHKGEARKWHGKPQVPPPYLLVDPIEL